MTILLAVLLTTSFLGFQLPVLFSALGMKKVDEICKTTLKNAKRIKGTGGMISLTFYKSACI